MPETVKYHPDLCLVNYKMTHFIDLSCVIKSFEYYINNLTIINYLFDVIMIEKC